MPCFRKESPSISNLSRLKPSLAFERVRACKMRPGFGPNIFGESQAGGSQADADVTPEISDDTVEGAVVLVAVSGLGQQYEVGFFTCPSQRSEFPPGVHSSPGRGCGSPAGERRAWTEVVVCVDRSLSEPGWEHWQMSRECERSSSPRVPLGMFLEQTLAPSSWFGVWRSLTGSTFSSFSSGVLQFLQGRAPSGGWEASVLQAVWSESELVSCLQWSLLSIHALGQEMKHLLSMDFFHPKSKLGYLWWTRFSLKKTLPKPLKPSQVLTYRKNNNNGSVLTSSELT